MTCVLGQPAHRGCACRPRAAGRRARLQLHLQQLGRAADAAQRVLDLVRQVAQQLAARARQAERALLAVLPRLLLDLGHLQQHAPARIQLGRGHAHPQRLGRRQRRAAQQRVEAAAGDFVALHRAQRLAHRRGIDEPVEHVAAHQRAARHRHRVLERRVRVQAVAVGARQRDHRGQLVVGLEAFDRRGLGHCGLLRRQPGAVSRKRRAAPSFLDPHGGQAGRSPAMGALTTKRRAAPSFLDPRGGQAGRSPALGALRAAAAWRSRA